MKIIIANTNIAALFEASDRILKSYSDNENIPEKIKGQVSLSVLKDTFQKKKHFSVCDIDNLAKMNDVIISAEHQEFFNALHCIQWEDMHQDTRDYLSALLVRYFKSNIAMANSNGQ